MSEPPDSPLERSLARLGRAVAAAGSPAGASPDPDAALRAEATREVDQLLASGRSPRDVLKGLAAESTRRTLSDLEHAVLSASGKLRGAELDRDEGPPLLGMKALVAMLPMAARLLAGTADVRPPLVQEEDVKKFKNKPQPIKTPEWQARMRAFAATREPGDPSQPYIERVLGYLYAKFSITKEAVRETYEQIAKACGMCADTAYRVIKFARENPGLLDITQVMGVAAITVKGQLRKLLVRKANAYVPHMPDELDAEAEKASPEVRRLARIEAQKRRWAGWFGLFVRPWGLNTTPLKTRRTQGELAPS